MVEIQREILGKSTTVSRARGGHVFSGEPGTREMTIETRDLRNGGNDETVTTEDGALPQVAATEVVTTPTADSAASCAKCC